VNPRSPLILLVVLVLFGAWLRLPRQQDHTWIGTDEGYYGEYLDQLASGGIASWPRLFTDYIAAEKTARETHLPPTRILFLGLAHGVHRIAGGKSVDALRIVSCAAGIAALIAAAAFAWRASGPSSAVGITALIACFPLGIHLSHRALIDGFFAFWALIALWGLWECLRAPERRAWLALYGAGLAAMVMTKENAAFAFAALLALITLNRWLQIGRVTPALLAVTFAAPALGVVMLLFAAGGIAPLIEAYRLNVQKSVTLAYAIQTGDGPWHRYLLDFLLVSPAITLLALAALGGTGWRDPAKRHLAVFLAISYAAMAQVRYGMNMRYGAMWMLPLCWLAFAMLDAVAGKFAARFRAAALASALAAVCALELHSYRVLFVSGNIYDPVAGALAMPLQMWKPLR